MNNHAENANKRLIIKIGTFHTFIWVIINCLKTFQSSRDYFYSQLTTGKALKKLPILITHIFNTIRLTVLSIIRHF